MNSEPTPHDTEHGTRPDPDAVTVDADGNVDKTGVRVQKMFGEISSRYDFMNHALSGGTDYYWRWRTVRRVRPQGAAPILDVCTGTGDLAFAWWNTSRGRRSVVGTDFTAEMIQLARKKSANLNSGGQPALQLEDDPHTTDPSICFLEADTLNLPFDNDRFQIVSVAFGLRNVSDTLAGLREMTRVCQPGGRVAVLEFSMPGNRLFRMVYRWYFRHVLPRIGQLLAPNREAAYKYLPESVSQFPQNAELTALMQEAGLTGTTWTPLTFGIATLYTGRKSETGRKNESER
ncbi:MAG: bifunctional demethylmenaquinone methyltransferase/2-methoxy-6-polyprenyl-1,4-benzoquinol methylase UbiE [Planctomycetaceae bacterium]